MSSFKVTIRVGPKVTRKRVPSLDDAIDVLELELRSLGSSAERAPAKVFAREIAPVAQVSARGEVSGDGSIEAYLGKVRREVVKQRRGESAFDALRRVLGAGG